MRRPLSVLKAFAAEVLGEVGVSRHGAELVAEHLVTADARGVSTHGLRRLPTYVARIQAGLINPRPSVSTVSVSGGTALVDGDGGLGFEAMHYAIERADDLAASNGVSAVGVKNSTHFGMAGLFAEAIATRSHVGIVMTNGAPRMAMWGGSESMLGTNPVAIAVPRRSGAPLLLDMATSAGNVGKIQHLADAGLPVPAGWALDSAGRPATDASSALQGVLLPVGGPKGSGLAVFIDILTGVLTGAEFGKRVGSMYGTWDRPEGVGHFVVAVSIRRFLDVDHFQSRLEEFLHDLKHSRPADGFDAVRLPGELESMHEVEAVKWGLELPPDLVSSLGALSMSLGLPDLSRSGSDA